MQATQLSAIASKNAGLGAFLAVIALVCSITALANPARAADPLETFGPGKVDCQPLDAGTFDCLLTSNDMSNGGDNVTTFSVATLPAAEQAMFAKWCSNAGDECTVELHGTRQTAAGSRLATVASIRWTRPLAPRDQAAARAEAARGTGDGSRPAD